MGLILVIGLAVLVFILVNRKSRRKRKDNSSSWIWQDSPERIGKDGEAAVAWRLYKLPKGKYTVLNDILLVSNNNSTQIDHIVVSCYGIFVIETKNVHGKVYGSEGAEYWKQYLPDWGYKTFGSTQEHIFRNPIWQNNGHVKAVKRLLSDWNVPVYGLVAFSNETELRISCDYPVMYWYDVVPFIEGYRDLCLGPDEVESIAEYIRGFNHESAETRTAHVVNVHKNEARRDKMVSSGRCPLCGGKLVLRNGKYGQFWGCSNYPQCTYKLNPS